MKNKQVSELYDSIIDDFLKGDYEGENKVIETENVNFKYLHLKIRKIV